MTKRTNSRYKLYKQFKLCLWDKIKPIPLKRRIKRAKPIRMSPINKYIQSSLKWGSVYSFAVNFIEKQKLRKYYGYISEKRFKLYLKSSIGTFNPIGTFFGLLERRLDVVIYRMFFADTIFKARQLVLHGYFTVNNVIVRKPGFLLRDGDVVSVCFNQPGHILSRRISDILNNIIQRSADVVDRLPKIVWDRLRKDYIKQPYLVNSWASDSSAIVLKKPARPIKAIRRSQKAKAKKSPKTASGYQSLRVQFARRRFKELGLKAFVLFDRVYLNWLLGINPKSLLAQHKVTLTQRTTADSASTSVAGLAPAGHNLAQNPNGALNSAVTPMSQTTTLTSPQHIKNKRSSGHTTLKRLTANRLLTLASTTKDLIKWQKNGPTLLQSSVCTSLFNFYKLNHALAFKRFSRRVNLAKKNSRYRTPRTYQTKTNVTRPNPANNTSGYKQRNQTVSGDAKTTTLHNAPQRKTTTMGKTTSVRTISSLAAHSNLTMYSPNSSGSVAQKSFFATAQLHGAAQPRSYVFGLLHRSAGTFESITKHFMHTTNSNASQESNRNLNIGAGQNLGSSRTSQGAQQVNRDLRGSTRNPQGSVATKPQRTYPQTTSATTSQRNYPHSLVTNKPQRNYPQGSNRNYPQGSNRNYPQGSNRNYPQGSNRNYPQGSNRNYFQKSNRTYPQGSNRNYPQGSNRNYPQGSKGSYRNYKPYKRYGRAPKRYLYRLAPYIFVDYSKLCGVFLRNPKFNEIPYPLHFKVQPSRIYNYYK